MTKQNDYSRVFYDGAACPRQTDSSAVPLISYLAHSYCGTGSIVHVNDRPAHSASRDGSQAVAQKEGSSPHLVS